MSKIDYSITHLSKQGFSLVKHAARFGKLVELGVLIFPWWCDVGWMLRPAATKSD